MFQNFIKTISRNFWRNKSHFLLNVLGLCLGMASGILIFLWIDDEKKIDAFHSLNVYGIFERRLHDGKVDAGYDTPALLADELKKAYPEIKFAVSSTAASLQTFQADNKIIKQKGIYAGKDFFNVYNYKIVKGDQLNALN